MAEVAPARLPEGNNVHKSSKHSKKRHRDPNSTEKSERKHKRSKSEAAPAPDQAAKAVDGDSKSKKRKGHKFSESKDFQIDGGQPQDEPAPVLEADKNGEQSERKKKHKKYSKRSKKKSRESHDQALDDDNDEDTSTVQGHPDIVVLNSSRSKTLPGATSSKHQYPFFTQTVSQYLPLHPLGINEPIQGYMNQHLEPLLNRYVPSFGGVLLAYRNPRLGEAPGKGSLTQDSAMEDMAVLESINEHAVSFGWLTTEIDIFQPSRGAWLEGLVNIQSGGHIGVVCWGKFNASIESGRLPRGWRWVDHHLGKKKEIINAETRPSSPSSQDNAEGDHTEVHATGYWVDGQGSKVTADTPICFRIKNYEVGSSGDYGYLSLEGTILTEEEEESKVRKEMQVLQNKLQQGSVLRRERRPLSELSITKFGNDDAREPESQRAEV